MSISFGLNTNLSTSQKLTPQMQQAIKLLQLSSLELAQEVQMKLDSNPLLERVDDELELLDDLPDHLHDLNQDFESKEDRLADYEVDSNDDSSGDILEGYGDLLTDSSDKALAESQTNEVGDGRDDPIDAETLPTADNEYDIYQSNSTTSSSDDYDDNGIATVDSSDKLNEDTIGELNVDSDWDDIYTNAPSSGSEGQDFDDYQGATSANLQDHIRWQLNLKRLGDTDLLIADYLIDSMDDNGIIEMDLKELEQNLATMASFYQWEERIEYDQILMVLHIIQSCEPLGVGARSLAECLQIQLYKLDDTTPYKEEAIDLLDAHEYLVSNNIKKLIERTGIKKEDIAPTLELIRTLNPAPGLAFTTSQPDLSNAPESYDIPDVIVTAIYQSADGTTKETLNNQGLSSDVDAEQVSWQVKLNPETLPKLRVNQEYANLVKRGDNSPDNVYLKDNLLDARLFIRSIEERNQNLLKVATSIVKRQQAFLLQGPIAMQPMILRDVAEEVDLHESTVSRLTTSKSILTPQGLFSLKHFFSSHVGGSDGDVSSTAISAMIEAMILAENPKKPLSDSAIQNQLQDEGIEIARRTVAKYREAMNIGSSTHRKQKY